ncbi:MAG: lytic murein transglycosylase, partial [Solirubrobacteraceae bacterium]
MSPRSAALRLLTVALAVLALGLPTASLAGESASTTTATTPPEAGEAVQQTVTVTPATSASQQEEATVTVPAPEAVAPQVQAEHSQGASAGTAASKSTARARAKRSPAGESPTGAAAAGEAASERAGAQQQLPGVGGLPSSTPPLPLDLRSSIAGVPSFFIESFQIPPFLLPIFQAAGTAYDVPWQVLAAINEVETDYGRDLSVSSAGAEGWMQFLPSEWDQYGVDANGDGYKDPYNPADAIFAAARYLRAAGANTNIKAAVYSYNHSQAYVESVMLRAQLLGGTPSELLGAITGLTEARFPVYATSHYSDGFPTVSTGAGQTKPLVGTTIYSQAGAPVIAVQDGEVVQVGDSPSLGRFLALRDAYGNTYVYAQLGEVASVYPVLEPRVQTRVSTRIAGADRAHTNREPAPSGPATAGAQPRSPLSEGAAVSGLALGAAAGLEAQPGSPAPPA